MTGDKQKRIVKNVAAADLYIIVPLIDPDGNLLFGIPHEIGECRWRTVPVAAPAILDTGNFELAVILRRGGNNQDKTENENRKCNEFFHGKFFLFNEDNGESL